MTSLKDLKREIDEIKERNKRVEADKSWETSFTRRFIITALTYIVIVFFFVFADLPNPLVNSIVPATAFILSTISLEHIKKNWIKNKQKT